MTDPVQAIYTAVLEGDRKASRLPSRRRSRREPTRSSILNEGMIAAMAEVGRCSKKASTSSRRCSSPPGPCRPGWRCSSRTWSQANVQSAGKVVVGHGQGRPARHRQEPGRHDARRRRASRSSTWASTCPPEKFVEAVRSSGAQIVAMSALLTTTMTSMKTTVEALKAAGLRDQVKVMIGGAPVTEHYAAEIGADGYATDASRAVSVAKSLMGK